MGLLFNNKATIELTAAVNVRFNSDNIDFWRDLNFPKRLEYFNPSNTKKLFDAARLEKIFGGGASGSGPDNNFQTWLRILHRGTYGDQIRKGIYDGLTSSVPGKTCGEIVFSIVPTKTLSVDVTQLDDPDDPTLYSQIITIHTPSWSAAVAIVKARRRALAKRKAARKKKT